MIQFLKEDMGEKIAESISSSNSGFGNGREIGGSNHQSSSGGSFEQAGGHAGGQTGSSSSSGGSVSGGGHGGAGYGIVKFG